MDITESVSKRFGFSLENGNGRATRYALRNAVDPEIGLMILNCARNIITKQNEKQTELF